MAAQGLRFEDSLKGAKAQSPASPVDSVPLGRTRQGRGREGGREQGKERLEDRNIGTTVPV